MATIYGDDVTEARALPRLFFVLEAPRGGRLVIEQSDLGGPSFLKVLGPRGGLRFGGILEAKEIDPLICLLGAARARMLAAQDPEQLAVYRRLAEKRGEVRSIAKREVGAAEAAAESGCASDWRWER